MTLIDILNETLSSKTWVIKSCPALPDGVYRVEGFKADTDDSLVMYVGDFALRLKSVAGIGFYEFKESIAEPAKPKVLKEKK